MAAMVLRSGRRSDPEDLPPPRELTAPIPPVLQFVPPAPPQAQSQQTLMGQPMVEGDFAKRYMNQKMGLNQGPDTSTPNIMRPDGRNAIDGSTHVQALNTPPGGGGREF
ncbi:MAG: hypothetical protein K2Q01_11570 [Rickettsiales bacterium]|nr:hypothetical protein [Rickettsiales bacterium]